MTKKIPAAIIHGISSRLANRAPDAALRKMSAQLDGEHDMTRPLTFIVKGYTDVDFHVMIALREGKWKVSILVVTKTILLTCDDAPEPAAEANPAEAPVIPFTPGAN